MAGRATVECKLDGVVCVNSDEIAARCVVVGHKAGAVGERMLDDGNAQASQIFDDLYLQVSWILVKRLRCDILRDTAIWLKLFAKRTVRFVVGV